jgi:hypothetical protein
MTSRTVVLRIGLAFASNKRINALLYIYIVQTHFVNLVAGEWRIRGHEEVAARGGNE